MTPIDINEFERIFHGTCYGVGISKRADDHACFTIFFESDGEFYISDGYVSSSYWLPELMKQIGIAIEWCKENLEPSMTGDIQYGWEFKND